MNSLKCVKKYIFLSIFSVLARTSNIIYIKRKERLLIPSDIQKVFGYKMSEVVIDVKSGKNGANGVQVQLFLLEKFGSINHVKLMGIFPVPLIKIPQKIH